MDTQITVLEKNSDSTCFVSACALNSIFGMNFQEFLNEIEIVGKKTPENVVVGLYPSIPIVGNIV